MKRIAVRSEDGAARRGLRFPAMAEEITPETFADRVVEWEFGEQDFLASGRTRDRLLTDSWGWWELRDDRLCLLWPPAEDWDCATTTIAQGVLRLEFDDGRVQTGRFRE